MTANILRKLLLSFALVFSLVAHGETISGRVVGISDGDTLAVLDASNTQHKIRLAAIDAPEKAQAFGRRGKQKLSELCYGKTAIVNVISTDRYGRSVGDVDCSDINVNEVMVQSGFAWVYRKYDKGHEHLYAFEDEARDARRGLWVNSNPIAPWEWRKARRDKIKSN